MRLDRAFLATMDAATNPQVDHLCNTFSERWLGRAFNIPEDVLAELRPLWRMHVASDGSYPRWGSVEAPALAGITSREWPAGGPLPTVLLPGHWYKCQSWGRTEGHDYTLRALDERRVVQWDSNVRRGPLIEGPKLAEDIWAGYSQGTAVVLLKRPPV